MSDWYDKAGKKLVTADHDTDPELWKEQMSEVEKLLTNMDYKRVAGTEVKVGRKKYWVSTVWLGLDHSWKSGGKPVIFETMIFTMGVKSKDNSLDYQTRYRTEKEALAGHEEAIKWVKEQK